MSNFFSNPCRIVGFKSANTTNNVAFTCGFKTYVMGVRVANVTGNTATVSLGYYGATANTEYSLVNQAPVPANSYVYFPFEGLALVKDDELRIQQSANNALHSVITVADVPGRSG